MGEKFWTYAMEEMSYPDVAEILKTTDIALIPIGSQEKHGPHIPLSCDSIATIETTRRAAYKAEVPYTPMIPVGYSLPVPPITLTFRPHRDPSTRTTTASRMPTYSRYRLILPPLHPGI